MSALRTHRIALEDAPTMPRLRVHGASFTGAAPVVPKLRIHGAGLAGAAAVVVNALAPQVAEPESTVTVTGSLVGGGAADSWTFRPISGPSIGLTVAGASATFTAPSTKPPSGAVVVVGVTATLDGTTSAEQTCTITLLPQVRWAWTGSAFVGAPKVPLAV